MTVKDIIVEWLKAHGYDGLYSEGGECACEMADLCPCDDAGFSCEPGYKRKPRADEDPDCKFYIDAERPEETLRKLLAEALPAVEDTALMADALDRHQVVPAGDRPGVALAADKAYWLAVEVADALGVQSRLVRKEGIEKATDGIVLAAPPEEKKP
jgi:hypothetical protein